MPRTQPNFRCNVTCKTFESRKRKHAFEPPNHASLSYIKLDLPASLISITMIGTRTSDQRLIIYVMLDRKKLPRRRTYALLAANCLIEVSPIPLIYKKESTKLLMHQLYFHSTSAFPFLPTVCLSLSLSLTLSI